MTDKLKGIIAGTGRAGTFLQRGAFLAAGAEIVAYVDTELDRAQKAAEQYDVPYYHNSIEEALDRHQPDFVSVCTPTRFHVPVAAAAIRAGCHVLVEKPVADTLEEAEELRKIAEEHGKTACVVHNHKFYPGIERAVDLYRSGALGDIVNLNRQMTFINTRVRMMEANHWAHQIPGGRLFEANPHNLYLAYVFVGKMRLEHVFARRISNRWPHALIDEFTAILSAGRATVQIAMSLNLEPSSHYQRHGPNFLVIIGTKATLLVDYHQCHFLEHSLNHPISWETKRVLKSIRPRIRSIRERRPKSAITRFSDGASSGHKYLIERFIGYLEGRYAEPPTSWEEVLTTQQLNYEMGSELAKKVQQTH